MRDYVIIVAGGQGLRMGGDIPKQFLPIGGRPVLMRTMERFAEYSEDLQIILVLPRSQWEYWRELCQKYDFPFPSASKASPSGGGLEGASYLLASGGTTRFHSGYAPERAFAVQLHLSSLTEKNSLKSFFHVFNSPIPLAFVAISASGNGIVRSSSLKGYGLLKSSLPFVAVMPS